MNLPRQALSPYKRNVSPGNEASLAIVCVRLGTRPEAWEPEDEAPRGYAISSPDAKWRPRESSTVSLPVHREDG